MSRNISSHNLNGNHHSEDNFKNIGNWNVEKYKDSFKGDRFNHCTDNFKNSGNWHVGAPGCPEGFNGYLGPNMHNKYDLLDQEKMLTNQNTPDWNQEISEVGWGF
jgi:hypothetical protein